MKKDSPIDPEILAAARVQFAEAWPGAARDAGLVNKAVITIEPDGFLFTESLAPPISGIVVQQVKAAQDIALRVLEAADFLVLRHSDARWITGRKAPVTTEERSAAAQHIHDPSDAEVRAFLAGTLARDRHVPCSWVTANVHSTSAECRVAWLTGWGTRDHALGGPGLVGVFPPPAPLLPGTPGTA